MCKVWTEIPFEAVQIECSLSSLRALRVGAMDLILNFWKSNKITGANAGGPRHWPMRTHWAARVAQF